MCFSNDKNIFRQSYSCFKIYIIKKNSQKTKCILNRENIFNKFKINTYMYITKEIKWVNLQILLNYKEKKMYMLHYIYTLYVTYYVTSILSMHIFVHFWIVQEWKWHRHYYYSAPFVWIFFNNQRGLISHCQTLTQTNFISMRCIIHFYVLQSCKWRKNRCYSSPFQQIFFKLWEVQITIAKL